MVSFLISGLLGAVAFYYQFNYCRQGKSLRCFIIATLYCVYMASIRDLYPLTGAIMLYMMCFYWGLWVISLFQHRTWVKRLPGDRQDPSNYRN